MINWVYAELLNSISGGKSRSLFLLTSLTTVSVEVGGHLRGPVDIWNKSALTGQDPFRITAPQRGQSLDEWFISRRVKCFFPAGTRCMLKSYSRQRVYAVHRLTGNNVSSTLAVRRLHCRMLWVWRSPYLNDFEHKSPPIREQWSISAHIQAHVVWSMWFSPRLYSTPCCQALLNVPKRTLPWGAPCPKPWSLIQPMM